MRSLAEAACARHGVECLDAVVKRGRTAVVRITVDREDGVDLDACAAVSQSLSRLLDADDPISGHYTLEVTTPGADRPLRASRDFARNRGRQVRVRTADGEITGVVVRAEPEAAVLTLEDGSEANIPLASILDARVVLPW